jgi:hypothetical protein
VKKPAAKKVVKNSGVIASALRRMKIPQTAAMPDYRRARIRCIYFYRQSAATAGQHPLIRHVDCCARRWHRCGNGIPSSFMAGWCCRSTCIALSNFRPMMPTATRCVNQDSLSKALPKPNGAQVRMARNERGIWQRRYWEHLIRDEADFRAYDYVHINPLKHGLPKGWQIGHSTFHRLVEQGLSGGLRWR